jgi:hypothetical protein
MEACGMMLELFMIEMPTTSLHEPSENAIIMPGAISSKFIDDVPCPNHVRVSIKEQWKHYPWRPIKDHATFT